MEDHRYLEGLRTGILMLEEQLTKKGSKLDKQTARKLFAGFGITSEPNFTTWAANS
jgi:hypothetical protein